MKRFSITASLALLMVNTFAAEITPVEKPFWSDPLNHPDIDLYAAVCLTAIVLVLVTLAFLYISRVLGIINHSLQNSNSKGKSTMQTNFLPTYWKRMIYGTVGGLVVTMISIFYISFFYIHNDFVVSNEAQVKVVKASVQATPTVESAAIKEVLVFSKDSVTVITRGKTVFENYNCGSCHRQDGGGNAVGPNLTDEYWLHGGEANDVLATIKNGVQEKGMPPWGGALSAKDLRDVTFFVLSLQGTNPADAKEPQGTALKQHHN